MSQTPEENLPDEAEDVEQYQSWDDYWAEVAPDERTETIRGVEVDVPANLPLKFIRELEQLVGSSREEDIRYLLTKLFGEDVLDDWTEAGMTGEEFQTALAWGAAQGQGRDVSFREAHEAVRTGGKSQAPESPTRSGATGARSRRTSGGSTRSRRKR